MPKSQKPEPVKFTVRMSPELRLIIDEMRGEKSINQIINEWLWSKAVGDGADRVADSLRPALALMDDADREEFVASAITVVEALTRAGRRQRRKG